MAKNDKDIFDKKKIIEALRAKGIPDNEIAKLYGPLPKANLTPVNSAKHNAYRKENSWKYDNKHVREERQEDIDPNYEPIEELRKKTGKKPPTKPRITKKKPKPKPKKTKNDWNSTSEARLKTLYEAGYSIGEMAREFKTTPDAITGKLTRMKKAGWKGMVGTTHNPIPSPSPSSSSTASNNKPANGGPKLNSTLKKMLASSLERNFGVVGTYFSKKWGLIDDNKSKKGGSADSADVTAAVIKSNQMILSSITKLDMTLRRGTSSLTKSLSMATSKMTDAINNTIDLVKKGQTSERLEGGGSGSVPTGKPGGGIGGAGGVGMIAALLGGGALAMLLSSRSEASTNPTEGYNTNDWQSPPDTEDALREEGAPKSKEDTPEIEVKVKELTFEADEITFEADDFKFTKKNQSTSSTTNSASKKTAGASGAAAPPVGGSLNNFLSGMQGGPGGPGFFNRMADKLFGTGGGDSKGGYGGTGGGSGGNGGSGGGPDLSMPDDNSWVLGGGKKGGGQGGNKVGGTSPGRSGSGGGAPSGTLAQQRAGYGSQLDNDPALKEKMMALMSAEEGGDSEARKMLAESAMNRGAVHKNSSLNDVLNPAYYEPMQNGGQAYSNHLDKVRSNPQYRAQLEKELQEVLKGSNLSNYATDNASGSVRANAERTQSIGNYGQNGEAFTRKDRDEFSNIHGAGVTKATQDWLKDTKAADEVASQEKAAGVIPSNVKNAIDEQADKSTGDGSGGSVGFDQTDQGGKPKRILMDMSKPAVVPNDPTTGQNLTNQQKDSDDDDIKQQSQEGNKPSDPTIGPRSDDSGGGDSFQTTLLETEGPNHFSDYPMSDQGIGA